MKILEKRCNDYLIHNEQITSNYEDLKRKFLQNNGAQRGDLSRNEEKINLLNQNLMENEKRIEELFDENENLKRKLNQEGMQKERYEEDKKQMSAFIEHLKNETQYNLFFFSKNINIIFYFEILIKRDKENLILKRSDDNSLLKRSIDNLKNDLFQMKFFFK